MECLKLINAETRSFSYKWDYNYRVISRCKRLISLWRVLYQFSNKLHKYTLSYCNHHKGKYPRPLSFLAGHATGKKLLVLWWFIYLINKRIVFGENPEKVFIIFYSFRLWKCFTTVSSNQKLDERIKQILWLG